MTERRKQLLAELDEIKAKLSSLITKCLTEPENVLCAFRAEEDQISARIKDIERELQSLSGD